MSFFRKIPLSFRYYEMGCFKLSYFNHSFKYYIKKRSNCFGLSNYLNKCGTRHRSVKRV
jgi:hypothetical protein